MFRLIEDSFWDDPPIAALSRDEKLITICLFTNVHTRPCGIYRLDLNRLARMIKVSSATVLKGLKRLAEKDIAHYDGLEVCIPGYIKKQRYKGQHMARRLVHELSQVKSEAFVKMIFKRYEDYLKTGGKIERSKDLPFDLPEAPAEEKKERKDSSVGLADFIVQRLKFTGGIRPADLKRLLHNEPGKEGGVRAAVARAEKYYATAKAEKWRHFVIARRFSKFCDFYGEAFSSDEALEEYLAKIRAANERERRKEIREASLHVGAPRPEVKHEEPEKPKTPKEIKEEEISEIKSSIERSIKFLEDPHKKVSGRDRKIVQENIDRYEARLKELQ